MTENIKHMRQIIENNDLTNDMTRAEALAVLDLLEADWRELTEQRDNFQQSVRDLVQVCKDANDDLDKMTTLAYHTAPNQLDFAPEGWTWKQQAHRDYDRLINAERENEHLKQRIADLEGTIGNALT